jgi:hypothetical protein
MSTDLRCANCNKHLDPTDKFCRECGLPTVHRAETQRMAAATPPNADELKHAMDAVPDPAPFVRAYDQEPRALDGAPELTTGSVIKVTNPTFAAQMAGSTLLMVGLIVVMVAIGLGLIVLALRF